MSQPSAPDRAPHQNQVGTTGEQNWREVELAENLKDICAPTPEQRKRWVKMCQWEQQRHERAAWKWEPAEKDAAESVHDPRSCCPPRKDQCSLGARAQPVVVASALW